MKTMVIAHPHLRAALVALVAASLSYTSDAFAQASQTADPSRVEDQIRDRDLLRGRIEADTPAPEVDRAARLDAQDQRFILSAVTIEGATVVSGEDIAGTYADKLATEIGPAELEEIAAAITAIYRDRGYALSRSVIPRQDVSLGLIRIQIIEGYVAHVSTSGTVPEYAIRGYAQRLKAERPLTLSTLERNMLLINDFPGAALKDATLNEDPQMPGAFELALDITFDALGGTLYTDNRGSAEVGPIQVGGSVELRNALGFGDAISLTSFTVPHDPEELQLIRVAYATPLGSSGLQASLSASGSWIDAGGTLDSIDDESNSRTVSAQISYPVLRRRDQSLWVSGTFDMRDAEEKAIFGTAFDETVVVLRGSISGMTVDPIGGRTYATVRVSKGVRMLGAAKKGDALLSRFDADPQAATVMVDISRYQQIIGDTLSATLSGRAQRASAPLVSSEEFTLGGARFGRGYEYGELTGDDGIAGSAEVTLAPDFGIEGLLSKPQFYVFYDTGAVWNRNIAFGDSRQSLSSAGFGLRALVADTVNGGIELAKPLDRDTGRTDSQEWQGLFFLATSF